MTTHEHSKHPVVPSENQLTNTAHPDHNISETCIKQIIEKSRKVLEDDSCYPDKIRCEFSKLLGFAPSDDFIKTSQKLYSGLYRSGDPEKFYSSFFATMPLKAEQFFPSINKHAAVLLVLKFGDSLITFEKERVSLGSSSNDRDESIETLTLSDQEKNALQYLAGYVLHNLHKKISKSRKYHTEVRQQALSFIESARSSDDDSQKLLNALNRGGLWKANETAQAIFLTAEKLFRIETNKPNIKQTDCPTLVLKGLNAIDTRAKFNVLLEGCKIEVNRNIGLDTLQQILSLYVKVRSFSFAKDIVEKYKNTEVKVKANSLRTEIKRSSDKAVSKKKETINKKP